MQSRNNEHSGLYRAWLEQKVQYQEATRLTALIKTEFDHNRQPNDQLKLLNEIMIRIGESDRRIAGMREKEKQLEMTDGLQLLMDELKTMVEHLLSQVQVVEQMARDRREKLKPQISKQVTQRRMLSAYSQQ